MGYDSSKKQINVSPDVATLIEAYAVLGAR